MHHGVYCSQATPHRKQKTWFGYWKNDGFIKTKQLGRIDINQSWQEVKKSWIEAYRNRDDIPGLCVKKYVTAQDEWCAEAYMETDYSTITESDFSATVKKHVVFNILREEEKSFIEEDSLE